MKWHILLTSTNFAERSVIFTIPGLKLECRFIDICAADWCRFVHKTGTNLHRLLQIGAYLLITEQSICIDWCRLVQIAKLNKTLKN